MVNPYISRPGWFNNPATCAILPSCVQLGATCGLHAFCHLLYSANAHRYHNPVAKLAPPNRREFEAVGLAGSFGDTAANLMQPGGSNYDITMLLSNFAKYKLQCFPMDSSELQGTLGKMSVVSGGRFHAPFANYVVPSGTYDCVGYLLRLPSHGGHWIAVLPGFVLDFNPAHPTAHISRSHCHHAAILCDSMFPCPFVITMADVECLLLASAMAAVTRNPSQFQGDWGCFLLGDTSNFLW